MNDLKSFIEQKISTARLEIDKVDEEIKKKAAALIAKKGPHLEELSRLQGLLKEYEKSLKAEQKPAKPTK